MWLSTVCFAIVLILQHEIYRLVIFLLPTFMSGDKVHRKVSPLQDKRDGLMAPDDKRPDLQLCVSTDTEIAQTLELCASDVSSNTEEEKPCSIKANTTSVVLIDASDSTVVVPNDGDQSDHHELSKTESLQDTKDSLNASTNDSEEKVINLSHLLVKPRQIKKRSGSNAAIDVNKASQISLRVKAKLQRQASIGSLHSQLQRQSSHKRCTSDGKQSLSCHPPATGSLLTGHKSSWNIGHLPPGRTTKDPSYASGRQRIQTTRQKSIQGRSHPSLQEIEDSFGSRTSGRPQRVRRRATVGAPRPRRPPLERGLSASQISDLRILERLWLDSDDE